jgi:hypothetical protein
VKIFARHPLVSQFFSEPKINNEVHAKEPFAEDIQNGRYTSIQVKEMVRSLYRAGLLLEGPASKHPQRIVYGFDQTR